MALRECLNIQAKVKLLTKEQGGRLIGIRTGYRPNHVFEYFEDGLIHAYIGEIQFEKEKIIELGEEAIVNICFFPVDELKKYLSVGRNWFIHEGQKLIGEGIILKVD